MRLPANHDKIAGKVASSIRDEHLSPSIWMSSSIEGFGGVEPEEKSKGLVTRLRNQQQLPARALA